MSSSEKVNPSIRLFLRSRKLAARCRIADRVGSQKAPQPMTQISASSRPGEVDLPESISVYVPSMPTRGRPLRPCFIGDEDDRLDLFLWLRCLPSGYTATHRVSQRTAFLNRSRGRSSYVLEIFVSLA
jgi:hypothetical protein